MRRPVALLCQSLIVVAAASAIVCSVSGQQDPKQAAAVARYRQWEREIPAASMLGRLKPLLERKYTILPPADLDDRSALPLWFRVYQRMRHPDLPTSGPNQYARTANRVLQSLIDEPDEPSLREWIERLQRER